MNVFYDHYLYLHLVSFIEESHNRNRVTFTLCPKTATVSRLLESYITTTTLSDMWYSRNCVKFHDRNHGY